MSKTRARTQTQRLTLAAKHDGTDLYGRLTIDGMRDVTSRRVRRATTLNANLYHRAKNGVYDPITYYHVADALARLDAGQEFRTQELMRHLRAVKPQIVWDATSLGRIVTDIAETLHETYGFTPIGYTKRWNGMTYDIIAHPKARQALVRLVDDLARLGEKTVENELAGNYEKRIRSPLERCASVMRQKAAAV